MSLTLDPQMLRPEQIEQAGVAARSLVPLRLEESPHLMVDGREIGIPLPVLNLVIDMLLLLARGDGVVVLPREAELTTQQAAELLKVSRPYVVQLIKDHELPARLVGTHRRILLADLLAYKQRDDRKRNDVLKELAEDAQEINPDY